MKKRYYYKVFIYVALGIISAFILIPFAWMFVTSLKFQEDVFTRIPEWIPRRVTLSGYGYVFGASRLGLNLRNSLIVASLTGAFALPLACLAAYSFSRFSYPGKTAFSFSALLSQMFPYVLLVIPLFILMQRLHLIDTYLSLIIAYATFAMPFSILMLWGFFNTLPPELEESALLDGCSKLGACVRITLPLSAPGLVATFLFMFIVAWNDLIYALVLTRTFKTETFAVAMLRLYATQLKVNWPALMGAGVISAIPVCILFASLQKYMVRGMSAGAIKG